MNKTERKHVRRFARGESIGEIAAMRGGNEPRVRPLDEDDIEHAIRQALQKTFNGDDPDIDMFLNDWPIEAVISQMKHRPKRRLHVRREVFTIALRFWCREGGWHL